MAREQEGKLWELCAAASLARLWLGLYGHAMILVVQAQLALLPTRKEAARRMLPAPKRARSRVPLTGPHVAGHLS